MMETVESSVKRLSSRAGSGRIANAVAQMLRRQLSVPHLYLKPRIPGYTGVDVVAVDRAGSGDVHGVEIKVESILPSRHALKATLKQINSLPVHFRYLAMNTPGRDTAVLEKLNEYDELFSSDGIGRVGIIAYDDRLLHTGFAYEQDLVEVVVRPERFLVRGEKLAALDKFLATAHPDMDVRM